ncbi:AAA family ATPase [Azohydromonas lata]|uniref:AAA family ATPase n=1 Tax=Azohydromonas lata TaxID=45677 RepID=UPI00082C6843|nr:AAA family ATPase [Azohydromonas lata]
MRLKSISLRDFRCFEHLDVKLHPRLTVLIGDNGAGKTAILDAIAIGLSPVLRHLSSANQRLKGVRIKDSDFRLVGPEVRAGRERWNASDTTQIIVRAQDDLVWDVWQPSMAGKTPEEKFGEASLTSYLEKISGSLNSSEPELLPVFAYYGARRGYIKIPERLHSTQANYNYPTAALVDALEPLSDFKEMLKWFDAEEAAELRANKGRPNPEYMPSRALDAVRATIGKLLGGAYENPHFNRDHKLVVEPSGGGAPLQVSQLSQGYQSMLALGLDFARRMALGNPQLDYLEPSSLDKVWEAWSRLGQEAGYEDYSSESAPLMAPAIMLVDEIDVHLHPSWQQRVLDDLLKAFPATQFIVTTHSPQVLTSVDAECIRLIGPVLGDRADGIHIGIQTVDVQTRGVASSDVLARIMGVDPVPNVPEAKMLAQYHELIVQNLHNSDEGLNLRSALEAHFGSNHPVMLDCDRMIRLESMKKRFPNARRAS